MTNHGSTESWSTQQLAEFLAVVSSYGDEKSAIKGALERTAEALEAEVAALVTEDTVEASIGFPVGRVDEAGLLAVNGGSSESIEVAAVGRCHALSVPLEDSRGHRLVVGRLGSEGFSQEERDLVRGMCRVLALTLRLLRLVAQERTLRRKSEREMTRRKRVQEEAERLRNEFFASVSHELRTPLTSIIGYTDLLLTGEGGDLTERQRGFLEISQRNARRELRLVNDLLFVSRLGAGEFELERGLVDLAAIVRDCIEAARPIADGKRLDLAQDLTEVPPCVGDGDRLAQLLDNLLSNAVKFTPEGGSVEVRLELSGDGVLLDVCNSGSFVPASERRRIFDRFYRTRDAGRQVAPGVGLGLAISKAIVDAHGGGIDVLSDQASGTVFRVRLPAWTGAAEPAGARAPAPARS